MPDNNKPLPPSPTAPAETAEPIEETYQELLEDAAEYFDNCEDGYTPETRAEYLDIRADGFNFKQWPAEALNRVIDAAMLKKEQPRLFNFYRLLIGAELTVWELCGRANLSQPMVWRNLKALEARGLVKALPPLQPRWTVV